MEKTNVFVILNPGTASGMPEDIRSALLEFGGLSAVIPSVWRVETDVRGTDVFDRISTFITTTDQLLVIDATNDTYSASPEQMEPHTGPTS